MSGERATLGGNPRFADRAYRAAANGYLADPHDWETAVHSALDELLRFLAREEEETARCAALASQTVTGLAERNQVVDRFVELLGPRPGTVEVAHPEVVAEAVGESVVELIRRYVEQNRVAELPDALPAATVLALTPFVGPETAEALALADGDRAR